MIKNKKKLEKPTTWLIIFCIVGFIITVISFYIMTGISFELDSNEVNNFGSFVGGLFGTILSFVTVLLLIDSNISQQNEIDKIKEKEDYNEANTRLRDLIDLYREQSKKYELKNGNILKATYNNNFKYYLSSIEPQYNYYKDKSIDKGKFIDYLSKFTNDEESIKVGDEMCKKMIYIFKYIDNEKLLNNERTYDLVKFSFLKEEFKILYFICLLDLYFSYGLGIREKETFIHGFYEKMDLVEFLQDDFLESLMNNRFLLERDPTKKGS